MSVYVVASLVAHLLFFKTLHLLYTKLQVLKSVSDPCIVMQFADLLPFCFVFWPYFVNTHCLLFSSLAMLSQCQSPLRHSLKNVNCNALSVSILPFCKALAEDQDERGCMCLHVVVYGYVFYKVSCGCVLNSHPTFYTFLSSNTGVRQFNIYSNTNSILIAPVTGFFS